VLDRLEEPDALALLARTAERRDVPVGQGPMAATELVRLLDGLPLAIELAAGRQRLFQPAELVSRLRQSTAILEDRRRPDRQRSLSAALGWTLDLLDLEACELFTRLGVFAGPVELGDIEEVLGADGLDVIASVATLLDSALLQRVETGDGFVRFGFPEAVRQEASRRLDASGADSWRRAHAVWQHERVWPLRIYEIVESHRVEQAHGTAAETRAALAWAWDNDRQLGREIALGLFPLAQRAGAVREARVLIDRVMGDPGAVPQVVDLVRTHAALVARSDLAEADECARPLTALFPELGDLSARFLCAQNSGIALTWEGRFDEALAWLDEARGLAREIGPVAEAQVLVIVADTLLEAGQPDAAAAAIAESDALIPPERSFDRGREIDVIRATLESVAGAHAQALDRHARALTQAELVGDSGAVWMLTVSLVRAFARARRERSMLEAAGVALATAAERSAQGDFVSTVFTEPEPAVNAALARLGPEGQAMVDAGRALEPGQRVKRLCVLIYAD
jgi:tetratricopeptide (TPR) repeat protein